MLPYTMFLALLLRIRNVWWRRLVIALALPVFSVAIIPILTVARLCRLVYIAVFVSELEEMAYDKLRTLPRWVQSEYVALVFGARLHWQAA